MKKCFRAPGRVIFLCNESGFCQRKEPARSEDRRAVSFQERGPARRAAPCARDPRSLRALIRSPSRLSGAPPRALTSGELRSPSAPPLRAARGEQRGPATSPPRPQVRPPPRAPFPGQLPARPRAHLPQAAEGARRAGRGARRVPRGRGGSPPRRHPRQLQVSAPHGVLSPRCPATAAVPLPPRGCCGDFRQAQITPNARAEGVDTHRLIRSCESQKNLLNHHSRK